MIEFEILVKGLFTPEQFAITYDPALHMPKTPPIQAWMDRTWEERLASARAQGVPLYESLLFRLVNAQQKGATLQLVLGDTSYKEYTTTRIPEFFQGRRREELANPLAVCSVVETSDGYILYEKRNHVAVHEGRYHVIAGFFERDRDMNAAMPDPFAAMRRELREETGIQTSDIREQYCLGSAYDVTTPHGELCFLTRLHIPIEEVHKREPEDNEIEHLLSLYVTEESLRDFILINHGNISATGEPNLLMYGGLKYGEAWFEEMMRELDLSSSE
jgi:8-oxo-dGTP pyrophosphatase MutT (NUDIX family)